VLRDAHRIWQDGRVDLRTVIGGNVARLREERGWRQTDLAEVLRWVGRQPWTRDTVASIETGRRDVAIEDLLLLALVFRVPVVEFFAGEGDADIAQRIHPPLEIPLEKVRELITGGASDLARRRARVRADLLQELERFEPETKQPAAMTLERTLAVIRAKFGVTEKAVDRAARSLWGHGVADEHQARLEERLPQGSVSVRSAGAHSGHVTRQLIAELEPVLSKKRRG